MSAYHDKSQGITFVYSNIFELYKKAKDSKIDAPFVAERNPSASSAMNPARTEAALTRALAERQAVESARVIKAGQAKVETFEARELETNERPYAVPMGVREAEEKAKRANMRPVANLQKNLNDLNSAHEKLRFLLQELDSLTKKK